MTELKLSHADAELLLPWFVNGTLAGAELDSVRKHLAACDDCRSAVDELSHIQRTVNESGTTPLVPEPRFDELNARIDRHENARRRGWVAAAIAAAAGLVAILYAAAPVILDSPDPAYRTATNAESAGVSNYVLDVRFTAGLAEDQRRQIVEKFSGRILSAGDQPDSFDVVIETSATSVAELDALVAELVDDAGVESARVVAVQLPVRENPE